MSESKYNVGSGAELMRERAEFRNSHPTASAANLPPCDSKSKPKEKAPKTPKLDRPVIVCLCGSTKFSEAFQRANFDETLAGKIVLTIGCDMKNDEKLFEHMSVTQRRQTKINLDALHLHKIDLADEILVLNVGGYIGESTKNEINYAIANGKRVRHLERP